MNKIIVLPLHQIKKQIQFTFTGRGDRAKKRPKEIMKTTDMNNSESVMNVANTWEIDENIDFGFFNEAYTSGRANLNDLTAMLARSCGIGDSDNSTWANNVRDIICYAVIAYDRALEEGNADTPDELNYIMTDYVSSALADEQEAASLAWDIRDAMKYDDYTGEGYYSPYEKSMFEHPSVCA